MALTFYPHAGMMLVCNFKGNMKPEIVKIRPVIIIARRLPDRGGLCMVVPTSTTPPRNPQPYHVMLSKNYHPKESDHKEVWAKCDLVTSVSTERLDRFRLGKGKYGLVTVSVEDLEAVRQGVLAAFGFPKI